MRSGTIDIGQRSFGPRKWVTRRLLSRDRHDRPQSRQRDFDGTDFGWGRYHQSHTISSSRLTGVFDTFPNSAKNVQYKFGISTQAIAIRVLTEQTVRRVLFLKYKFIASSPPTACLQRFKFESSFFVKFKNPFR